MTPTNPPTVPPDRPAARPRIVIPRELLDRSEDLAAGVGTTDRPAPTPVADERGHRSPGVSAGWRSGITAGLQASVLALAVTVAPAIAAYISTAGSSANADTAWTAALTVGITVWLQGFGGVATVSGVTYSIIPLGVSIVMVALSRLCARRSLAPTLLAWLVMICTSGVVTAIVGLAFGGPARGGVPRAVIGAMVLAGVGAAWGVRSIRRRADVVAPWATGRLAAVLQRIERARQHVPRSVRIGVAAAWIPVLTVIAMSALVVCWWIIAGRDAITTVFESLRPDPVGVVVLMLTQLALLPLLVVWAVGWLVGPGFAVGAGTMWSTSTVTTAPLPALPILGALPERAVGLPLWVVVVAAGVFGGWWAMRRLTRVPAPAAVDQTGDAAAGDGAAGDGAAAGPVTLWWHGIMTVAVMAVTAGVLLGGLSLLGMGAAGPGRLATMGADPLAVGLSAAIEILGGGLVALVITHPATGDLLRRRRAGH